MKVAVVGCGNISRNHFSALNDIEDVQIVAAVDIKPERADMKAEQYGARAYYDLDEMLINEHPDCVHIATPHYLHTPMAIKVMESGADVFLEKPCSVSISEARALADAQARTGRQVGVCFQNRYNDSTAAAKEIVDGGSLGKLLGIRAFVTWSRGEDYYSDDWHGKADKECGGVLINQAIHTIDLMQYLAGGCKALTAHVSNDHLRGIIEVEDNAGVIMELSGGVKGILYATTAYAVNSDVMIELTLEKGNLRIEGESLYQLNEDGAYEYICGNSEEDFVGKNYWGHGHKAIIRDFYDCIKTGRKFEIDAVEGGKAARIVASCYESSAKNERIEVTEYDS